MVRENRYTWSSQASLFFCCFLGDRRRGRQTNRNRRISNGLLLLRECSASRAVGSGYFPLRLFPERGGDQGQAVAGGWSLLGLRGLLEISTSSSYYLQDHAHPATARSGEPPRRIDRMPNLHHLRCGARGKLGVRISP